MSDESVTVTVDWTPGLMTEANGAFRKAAPKTGLWMFLGSVFFSFFFAFTFGTDILAAILGVPELHAPSYDRGQHDAVFSILGGIFLAAALVFVLNRVVVRNFYAETPFFERAWSIELSVQGIRTQGPYNNGWIDWPAVVKVVQSKNAIVLSLGGGGFLPLPHAGLPEGLAPEDLAGRIEVWRGAGDF